MTCQMITSLGVYLLGAACPGERLRIEAHLPGCAECQAELTRLAPLPGLLARVPDGLLARVPDGLLARVPDGLLARVPDGALAPGPPSRRGDTQPAPAGRGDPQQTPARRAGSPPAPPNRHRRPGRPWLAVAIAAAAAATAAAVTTVAAGVWQAPAVTRHRPAALTVSGANPAIHVTATAALTSTSWGTSIELRLDGVPLNVPCRLIVRSTSGATEVSGIWDAWAKGPITVPASADWRTSDIASLQVASPARNLVTIRVSHRH
jgi:hypothetical protein